jgi:hypothetical protein
MDLFIFGVYKMSIYLRKRENIEMVTFLILGIEKSLKAELLYFFYGKKNFALGVVFPVIYAEHLFGVNIINFSDVYRFTLERYMAYYLFQISTHGDFFYDDYPELLQIRRFRHSTLLEIVWATFPTIIIVLILIPSLYLLYSAEEDLDPEFTIKVIGHQ